MVLDTPPFEYCIFIISTCCHGDCLKTVIRVRQKFKLKKMRKIFFVLFIFFGSLILSSYSHSMSNYSGIRSQENKLTCNISERTIWLEIEWDYRGCHYTEDLFLNNQLTGGTGFITRKCGKNPSETYQFTITAIHYARVTSGDIQWDDPLPEDIDDSDFRSFFIDRTNDALATLG